jgi:hypothetical protein
MTRWHSPGRRARNVARTFPYRPRLEALEGRDLPSTVTNLNDAGAGSLRQAILDTPAGGTVDFQPGLSGTITLTGGELLINKNLTITGPGADVITVSGNRASRVFEIAATFTVVISGLTIANGHLVLFGDAGAGLANRGTLTLRDSTIADNRADGAESAWGGGIVNRGTLTILNSLITRNIDATFSGGGGAGIANAGTLIVTGSTISANAGGGGNGILNYSAGTTTVSDSTVFGNTANTGGGIANQNGTVTVNNSTLAGNMGGFGDGGVENLGMMAISNSTVFGNGAQGGGGGIGNGGTLTITNSTISGNTNTFGGRGGGVLNDGTLNMHNTILAGNSDTGGAPDLSGALTSSGYNLVGNTQGGSGYDVTDLLNVDPRLGPLQDNGGPTQTMALMPGSPAIDAGDNTGAPMWDQRGAPFRRIVNGIIDIGAFEVQARGHGGPTHQPLPGPVPVQVLGTPAGPLFGQLPTLTADPSPLPGMGTPDGQPRQVRTDPVPVPTAGGQQGPESFTIDGGHGQPVDSLGPAAAGDLDWVPFNLLAGATGSAPLG